MNTMHISVKMLFNSILYCFIYIPPELYYIGIGATPCVNKRPKLILFQTHFQSPHCFQCSDRASITQSQFCNLSLLPKMGILAMFFNRNTKHLRCTGTVNIPIVGKDFQTPGFIRQ